MTHAHEERASAATWSQRVVFAEFGPDRVISHIRRTIMEATSRDSMLNGLRWDGVNG